MHKADVLNVPSVIGGLRIWKRVWLGSRKARGAKGQRWWERIRAVIVTCAQQGRSVFHFLRDAVAEHLAGQPPPLLLPAGS